MPPACLIDLTRTVSRVGLGPLTGIDRVEAAWLGRLLEGPRPLFGLVRTVPGFLLLDRAGCAAVRALLRGEADAEPGDLIGRLTRRRRPVLAQAEATLRRRAAARAWAPGLARMLARHLPPGTVWLNLGHADLTPRTVRAVRAAGLRAAVMLHDTIPRDRPDLCRPGTAAAFGRSLAAAAAADLVIHPAWATRAATEAHLARLGPVPRGIVAPLGVVPGDPARARLAPPSRPFFLALGTIEPRKNHAFLLDIWEALPPEGRPLLVVAGRRGWAEPALFARLAAAADVAEMPGLSDDDVALLLSRARGLLFPTLAEGFGLPAHEAAAFGTPVLCPPHAVFREGLGDLPVYLPMSDPYAWADAVLRLTRAPERRPARTAPGWDGHIKSVLTAV